MGLREEKLKADIEEMEKVVYGTEDTKEGENSTDTVNPDDVAEPAVETVPATGESEAPRPDAEPNEEENWKAKYDDLMLSHKKLRANSDNSKFNLRTQIKQKDERILELETALRNVPREKEDIFKDTFTKEEEEALGSKAVAAMKKASETASNSTEKRMQAQIDAANKRADDAEATQNTSAEQSASTNFLTMLEKAVPNFREINLEKGFESYIYGDDPVNGGQRITWFKRAEQAKDVATVARYMQEYTSSLAKPEKEDKLAERVTPVGDNSAAVSTEKDKRTYLRSDMEKFYKDVQRGKYKGKASLLAEHQSMWDNAFEGGLIDMMR